MLTKQEESEPKKTFSGAADMHLKAFIYIAKTTVKAAKTSFYFFLRNTVK